MKDLQAIIDKRAAEKLNAEINAIDSVLSRNWKLLKAGKVFLKKSNGEFNEVDISSILGTSDGFTVRGEVYNSNIELYKQAEAEAFIEEVEELKNKVAYLNEEINLLQ